MDASYDTKGAVTPSVDIWMHLGPIPAQRLLPIQRSHAHTHVTGDTTHLKSGPPPLRQRLLTTSS